MVIVHKNMYSFLTVPAKLVPCSTSSNLQNNYQYLNSECIEN